MDTDDIKYQYLSQSTIELNREINESPIYLTKPKTTPDSNKSDLSTNTIPTIPTVQPHILKNVQLPIVRNFGITKCIDELATIFGIINYKNNLIEFWYLDMLTDCLWRTQDDYKLPLELQRVALSWIIFFLNILKDDNMNYTKNEIFNILKEAVLLAGESLNEDPYLPFPDDLFTFMSMRDFLHCDNDQEIGENEEICYLDVRTTDKRYLYILENESTDTNVTDDSISSVSYDSSESEITDEDDDEKTQDQDQLEFKQNIEMEKLSTKTILSILDFLFEFFYNDFQYSVIHAAITNPPNYTDEIISQLNVPKKLYYVEKQKSKVKGARKNIDPFENIINQIENYKKYIYPLEPSCKFVESMNDEETKN